MPGKGISDLPMPGRKHDPARVKRRLKRKPVNGKRKKRDRASFESHAASAAEDQKRLRMLEKRIEKLRACGGVDDLHAIESLITRFRRILDDEQHEPTLASSVFFRNERRRIVGAIFKLLNEPEWQRARFAAIVLPEWEIPADDLHLLNPTTFLERLRQTLIRQGATNADGWLFMGIDGEYDEERGVWVIHVHLIVAGGMINVVKRVSKLPKFRSLRKAPNSAGESDSVRQRVRMTRKRIDDPVAVSSYIIKSFWPARTTYVDTYGKTNRQRLKRRLPEPQHTQFLLWMDRWSISDLTLMMGLRVTRSGLRVTNLKTNTNGDKV